MKFEYIIKRDGYKYKPIIELKELNVVDSDSRMCNCCRSRKGIRKDLSLGCDNCSVSVCICDECLIVLHDIISEFLENQGGE